MWKNILLLIMVLFIGRLNSFSLNSNAPNDNITIILKVFEKCRFYDLTCKVYFLSETNLDQNYLTIRTSDEKIFTIDSIVLCKNDSIDCENVRSINETTYNNAYLIKIKPTMIGAASFLVNLNKNGTEIKIYSLDIIIFSPERIVDKIFMIWVGIFQTTVSFLMGILIDREAIFKIIKMPVPVLVGVFCQYLIMPLLAFSLILLIHLSPIESFAIFIYGCLPGGAASNNWTILFNGDVDLSALLTFCSVSSSLVVLPMWIYSLGSFLSEKTNIKIPFLGLLKNLCSTILPCLLGMLICFLFPIVKKIALKIAKPFTFIVLFIFLMLALVAKFYVFSNVKLIHWFAGPLIPWLGYCLGAFVAWLLRLPIAQIKTIALETGIQNLGLAYLIIYTNFPSPDSDLATFPLITIGLLAAIPLYLAKIIIKVKDYVKNKNSQKDNSLPEVAPMIDIQ